MAKKVDLWLKIRKNSAIKQYSLKELFIILLGIILLCLYKLLLLIVCSDNIVG